MKLLIIDEHPAVRGALALRLASVPAIDVIGTAARAEDLDDSRPDVVLLGLRSHDHSLKRAVRTVRTLAQRGTAVIVLTPYADDVEREQLLRAGACRYLLKDINTPQLMAEIEAACRLPICD